MVILFPLSLWPMCEAHMFRKQFLFMALDVLHIQKQID